MADSQGKSDNRGPLDTQEISVTDSQGNVVKVPAIDKHFMEIRQFVLYKPISFRDHEDPTYGAAKEEWIQRMEYLQEDLDWLLKLPHHKFWSQVVYDDSLHRCLDSYLLRALRDFELPRCCLEADEFPILQRIHKLIFFVFLRMSTYKESKHNYISPGAFGELIYDNYLFDIPKLMDLCALYGSRNSVLLKKMVSNVFTTQPSYMDDLESVVPHLFVVLDLVKKQLNLDQNHDEAPAKLGERISVGISSVSFYALLDVIHYITDISRSISAFLDIYPQASHMFFKHGFATKIAFFYDMVFPAIENELLVRENEKTKRVLEQAKFKVRFAKTLMVKIFRNLITMCCVQPITEAQSNNSRGENLQESTCSHLETYMEIFTEVVAHKYFIRDYNIMYPFQADMEMLSEIALSFDPTRLDYILKSIHQYSGSVVCDGGISVINKLAETSRENYHHKAVKQHDVKDLQGLAATLTNVTLQTKSNGMELSDSSSTGYKNDVRLDSLITSVLEIFPGLGEGFIEACLEYYRFDIEMVIDVLLRGNLPDCLSTLDRDRERMPVPNKDGPPSSLLTERRNVYDNDEFDIFNRPNVDMQKIHKGKKNKTPDTYQGLSDGSSDISALLKAISLSYEESHEGGNNHIEMDVYDDEYDDTYDSLAVGQSEKQTEDFPSIRPFVTPRVLEQKKKGLDSSNIRDEDEGEREQQLFDADEFIPNPAVLREIALQKRKVAMAIGGKQYNYRENSKGQNSVERPRQSRHNKEKHKSQIANHNRKRQSDFKRSRGMGPLPPQ